MVEEAHPGLLALIWFGLCSPGSVPVMLPSLPRQQSDRCDLVMWWGSVIASEKQVEEKNPKTFNQDGKNVVVHLPAIAKVYIPLDKGLGV